jgi:thiol-disulfide isomerase/thioredoxin
MLLLRLNILAFALGLLLAAQTVPRPRTALEVSMTPPGPPLNLDQFKGKPIVMVFIKTTCQHCQETVVALSAIQKQLGDKVQVVAAEFTTPGLGVVPDFVRRFQPTFPVGWVGRDAANQFLQISPMNPGFVPKLTFIDRKGVIRFQVQGGDPLLDSNGLQQRLEAKIQELIKIK